MVAVQTSDLGLKLDTTQFRVQKYGAVIYF